MDNQTQPAVPARKCRQCGYVLHGLALDRCSECGTPIVESVSVTRAAGNPTLAPCPACSRSCSTLAESCVHCGHPLSPAKIKVALDDDVKQRQIYEKLDSIRLTLTAMAVIVGLVSGVVGIAAYGAVGAGWALGGGLLAFFYLLPTWIATDHFYAHSNVVFGVNFFLGWSGLAWIVCLIWAFMVDDHEHRFLAIQKSLSVADKRIRLTVPSVDRPPILSVIYCPQCESPAHDGAKLCGVCGHRLAG